MNYIYNLVTNSIYNLNIYKNVLITYSNCVNCELKIASIKCSCNLNLCNDCYESDHTLTECKKF
jgi:hypothetical protein